VVDYTVPANKSILKGHRRVGLPYDKHRYDSDLERAVAMLNIRNGLKFQPHKTYQVTDRDGTSFEYTPDFVYSRPYKFKGITKPVSAIEVKGVLKPNDFRRLDAWEYTEDRNMWIALPGLVKYWCQHSFVEDDYRRRAGR